MNTTAATMTDTPAKPVIIYDGECPFCRKQVTRFKDRDDQHAFEFVPRQAEGLEQRFPQILEGDFNTGMRLIETDGTLYAAADAVYQITRRLRGFRNLAWLYRVPVLKQICQLGYAWIAKNRYRLAKKCEDDACTID